MKENEVKINDYKKIPRLITQFFAIVTSFYLLGKKMNAIFKHKKTTVP